MPATEQTWRNLPRLHLVFAVSGVVLLIATVAMLYEDHVRPWKPYQRTRAQVEQKTTQWRQMQQLTTASLAQRASLQEQLAGAQLQMPDLAAFKAEVNREAKERGVAEFDFARIDGLRDRLDKSVAAAHKEWSEVTQARQTATDVEGQLLAAQNRVTEQQAKPAEKGVSRKDAQEIIAGLQTRAAQLEQEAATARNNVKQAESEAASAQASVVNARTALFDSLRSTVNAARFREENLLVERKFKNADLDAAKANLGLLVRDGLEDQAAGKEAEALIHKITREIEGDEDYVQGSADKSLIPGLTRRYQWASEHRNRIQKSVAQLTAPADEVQGKIEKANADLVALQKQNLKLESTWVTFSGPVPFPGKKWLTLPILNAFGSPERPDQIWLPEVTQDFNFKRVARFDRCVTCHQTMAQTAPDTATDPAYPGERRLEFVLTAPARDQLPAPQRNAQGQPEPYTLEDVYGLKLASEGLLDLKAATVALVLPRSRAAQAALASAELRAAGEKVGLQLGDVIETINGNIVDEPAEVARLLIRDDRWGQPARLVVRRGLPNPYASHPRLDLFVGDASPHKMGTFGCTICHEGQDSGTAFKWCSHTPNDAKQRSDWSKQYGWFDNHDWTQPMHPERFNESGCLKCHHEVVELRASEKFAEAPAPKLVHGYDLIRKYGCYGCHEVNGYDGPTRRVGPDLRTEPNFFAAAQQVRADQGFANLSPDEQRDVQTVIDHPEQADARRRLLVLLQQDQKTTEARLAAASHAMAGVLKDQDTPGTLRRPGPSLRYASGKMDKAFLADWIHEPKNFRASTRMPQFFGLHSHLEGTGLKVAADYEPVEILGITEYLLKVSQSFEPLPPATGVTADPSPQAKAARGRVQFETRGCLACHDHREFKDAAKARDPNEIVQGPDLSNVAQKFAADRNPRGRAWLYSWIKEPSRYHARTVMPDLFLDALSSEVDHPTEKDAAGQPKKVTVVSDPADDIVEFLLSTPGDWQPSDHISVQLNDDTRAALDGLSLEHLAKTFHERVAKDYLRNGIPESERANLKGAEVELVGDLKANADQMKLLYVGRKAIAKYGCYGCHDIPGFEDAKPIGTSLADWGKKDPSRLAFEHIMPYLHHQEAHGPHAPPANDHDKKSDDKTGHVHEHAAAQPHESVPEADAGFYHHALEGHNRTGFIYQKLKEPRSYDYKVVEHKPYNDRLRMPQFPFAHADREAIITFVLGLLADPPAKLVYVPTPRQKALVEGSQVLEKYNCAGCHMLNVERLHLAYQPGQFETEKRKLGAVEPSALFPFVEAHFTSDELERLAKADPQSGQYRAVLSGLPRLDKNGIAEVYDDVGDAVAPEDLAGVDPATLTHGMELFRPLVIARQVELEDAEGKVVQSGVQPTVLQPGVQTFKAPAHMIERRLPAEGGFLAKYLVPRALELERIENPAAEASQVWAWLPPPLVGQGSKVQPAWLHEFLLNPYKIRPATFLRMPRFNMSPEEATKLVNYFAALDNAEYPYAANEAANPNRLKMTEQRYAAKVSKLQEDGKLPPAPKLPHGTHLDDAMRIVVDQNYCVKCHQLGEFLPQTRERGQGPDLSQVYKRLRPDYVRRWIANPKQILPYTAMPNNVPYDITKEHRGGVSQDLYHGDSVEQVDALVDLLMVYDQYTKERTKITPLVDAARPPPEAKPADPANPAADNLANPTENK